VECERGERGERARVGVCGCLKGAGVGKHQPGGSLLDFGFAVETPTALTSPGRWHPRAGRARSNCLDCCSTLCRCGVEN
jgi:hypothetical protein